MKTVPGRIVPYFEWCLMRVKPCVAKVNFPSSPFSFEVGLHPISSFMPLTVLVIYITIFIVYLVISFLKHCVFQFAQQVYFLPFSRRSPSNISFCLLCTTINLLSGSVLYIFDSTTVSQTVPKNVFKFSVLVSGRVCFILLLCK